ncbi:uridine kinase [Balneola sp. MJW-20]|uniref:uridine kinase n=1 Tax=Gracilimonas aurantiaca TaxID=3234185 RepID=UPI0034652B71
MASPLIIGVAGGSGSGKTTVVNYICEQFGTENLLRLEHDSYYRDLKHIPFEERVKQNFDHPSSLETELMIRHIQALMEGYEVEIPKYDFSNHIRMDESIPAVPTDVILIDGILIFTEQDLLDLMDVKIFVDTDDDVRLLRRLRRDIEERGRTVNGVLDQYEKFVRPMHLEFVEPSKRYADIIIPRGGQNTVALEMVSALINNKMSFSPDNQ